ncbi:MAG: fibronectin type III domain-containing protein, partial [Chloroflexi bacterium]|nr:fibronectin type III domain-containing protein [Chloroflexota bacterium]
MAIRRPPQVTVEMDWARDGMFAHAHSDLGSNVTRFRERHGATDAANPERPLIQSARGQLRLEHPPYVRGRAGYIGDDVLRRRHRCRLKVGRTVRWTGWAQNPRHIDRGVELELEGLRRRAEQSEVMVTQPQASGAMTTTPAVLTGVAKAMGLTGLAGSQIEATPLARYGFAGRAGQYLSQFCQVAGVFPVETAAGSIGLYDPTHEGAAATDFLLDSSTHDIRRFDEDDDSEQLFNILAVVYPGNIDQMADATLSRQNTMTASGKLPPSPRISGDDVLVMSVATSGSQHNYPVTLSVPAASGAGDSIVSGRFRVRVYEYFALESAYEVGRFSRNEARWFSVVGESQESGVYDRYIAGSLQTDGSLQGVIADRFASPFPPGAGFFGGGPKWGYTWPLSNRENSRIVAVVYYRVTAEYLLRVPGQEPVIVSAAAAVEDWDPRTLKLAPWIESSATASLQARIEALAKPRSYYSFSMPLGQPTAKAAADVLEAEPGSYGTLRVRDTRLAIDVEAHCMVMSAGYELARTDRGLEALKRFRLIGTGNAARGQIPSAPPAPIITAINTTSVGVTWTAPRGGITSYDLRYRRQGETTWITVPSLTERTHALTGLGGGTTYEAQVRATNSAGTGPWSATGTGSTAQPTAPTAPAAPAAPTLVAGDGEIAASWSAPSDTGSSAITHYDLRYRTGSGSWTEVSGVSGTSRTITNLTNGSTYEVQVRAANSAGDGPWSASASATPAVARVAPSVPRNVAVVAGDGEIAASWSAPSDTGSSAITHYDLRYRTGSGSWTEVSGVSGTSRTITNLTNGSTYEVQVRAANSAGDGPWSASASATPAVARVAPSVPRNVAVVAGDRQLLLRWDAPNTGDPQTSYRIEWAEGISPVGNHEAAAGDLNYIIANLTNGTEYTIRIRAQNATGNSAYVTV